jgi:DNA-binding CsgD family transcriptional regulator
MPTTQRVIDTLANAVRFAGFRFFCLNLLPRPGQNFAELIIKCEVPPGWRELYLRNDFATVDPALRHCRKVVMPFAYRNAPYDPKREPRAAEVVQRAIDFGLGDGIVIPVLDARGSAGDLWLGGRDEPLPHADLPPIHLLTLYAFHRIQQLGHPAFDNAANLNAREQEVLKWVADGKTAREIGELLNISRRTVEWHIQHAIEKLGAANRMQAVVIAARDRLIDIS